MISQGGGGIHFPLGSRRSTRPEDLQAPPTAKRALDAQRLERPVTLLPGVGPATARRLQGLEVASLDDLLHHLPFRYETPGSIVPIAELKEGGKAVVRGRVTSHSLRRSRKRRLTILEALIQDDSGTMRAVWYNQGYLQEVFDSRPEVLVTGSLKRRGGSLTFQVQGHEVLGEEGYEAGVHTTGIVPVYPSTGDLSVRRLRSVLARVVPEAIHVTDPLPSRIIAANRFPSKATSLVCYHFPSDLTEARVARSRLAYEELLLLQLALLMRRQDLDRRPGRALGGPCDLSSAFLAGLPYDPTAAQKRVIGEIEADMVTNRPMSRLLQGDVGSGKTMVATYSLLRAVETGTQAALLVPTEVLADQHAERLQGQLEPLGVEVGLLKGSQSETEKAVVRAALARGALQLVVGTHSLLQEGVSFEDLRVVVVDEQHRFGVEQRQVLTEAVGDEWVPHALHMTATPIPRTLSLTAYGDLDVSTIDELPVGRKPVKTSIFEEAERGKMWEMVREELEAGRRAYVVCPVIEDGEDLKTVSVLAAHRALRKGELRGYQVEIMHGRMSAEDKRRAMRAFSSGETDVLVSTTVIEVGIDVREAAVMVIEGAWRFGLSQLHQLRGRVGRGEFASQCLLPVPAELEKEARDRLTVFARTADGFLLAEKDLHLRGEGQLFGERQAGLGDLRVARLLKDRKLLESARREAQALLASDRGLHRPQHRLLAEAVMQRFGENVRWLDKT